MYTIRGGIRVMLLEQQFGFFVELGAGWEVNTQRGRYHIIRKIVGIPRYPNILNLNLELPMANLANLI